MDINNALKSYSSSDDHSTDIEEYVKMVQRCHKCARSVESEIAKSLSNVQNKMTQT